MSQRENESTQPQRKVDDLPRETEDVTPEQAEKAKGGLFPDISKVPSPTGPIPIPYPNF